MIGLATTGLATTAFADCAVCAANNVQYGWFILAGTVLLLSMAGAGLFAWNDARKAR